MAANGQDADPRSASVSSSAPTLPSGRRKVTLEESQGRRPPVDVTAGVLAPGDRVIGGVDRVSVQLIRLARTLWLELVACGNRAATASDLQQILHVLQWRAASNITQKEMTALLGDWTVRGEVSRRKEIGTRLTQKHVLGVLLGLGVAELGVTVLTALLTHESNRRLVIASSGLTAHWLCQAERLFFTLDRHGTGHVCVDEFAPLVLCLLDAAVDPVLVTPDSLLRATATFMTRVARARGQHCEEALRESGVITLGSFKEYLLSSCLSTSDLDALTLRMTALALLWTSAREADDIGVSGKGVALVAALPRMWEAAVRSHLVDEALEVHLLGHTSRTRYCAAADVLPDEHVCTLVAATAPLDDYPARQWLPPLESVLRMRRDGWTEVARRCRRWVNMCKTGVLARQQPSGVMRLCAQARDDINMAAKALSHPRSAFVPDGDPPDLHCSTPAVSRPAASQGHSEPLPTLAASNVSDVNPVDCDQQETIILEEQASTASTAHSAAAAVGAANSDSRVYDIISAAPASEAVGTGHQARHDRVPRFSSVVSLTGMEPTGAPPSVVLSPGVISLAPAPLARSSFEPSTLPCEGEAAPHALVGPVVAVELPHGSPEAHTVPGVEALDALSADNNVFDPMEMAAGSPFDTSPSSQPSEGNSARATLLLEPPTQVSLGVVSGYATGIDGVSGKKRSAQDHQTLFAKHKPMPHGTRFTATLDSAPFGMQLVPHLSDEYAGVTIASVNEGSPAAHNNLAGGDIVTVVDGIEIGHSTMEAVVQVLTGAALRVFEGRVTVFQCVRRVDGFDGSIDESGAVAPRKGMWRPSLPPPIVVASPVSKPDSPELDARLPATHRESQGSPPAVTELRRSPPHVLELNMSPQSSPQAKASIRDTTRAMPRVCSSTSISTTATFDELRAVGVIPVDEMPSPRRPIAASPAASLSAVIAEVAEELRAMSDEAGMGPSSTRSRSQWPLWIQQDGIGSGRLSMLSQQRKLELNAQPATADTGEASSAKRMLVADDMAHGERQQRRVSAPESELDRELGHTVDSLLSCQPDQVDELLDRLSKLRRNAISVTNHKAPRSTPKRFSRKAKPGTVEAIQRALREAHRVPTSRAGPANSQRATKSSSAKRVAEAFATRPQITLRHATTKSTRETGRRTRQRLGMSATRARGAPTERQSREKRVAHARDTNDNATSIVPSPPAAAWPSSSRKMSPAASVPQESRTDELLRSRQTDLSPHGKAAPSVAKWAQFTQSSAIDLLDGADDGNQSRSSRSTETLEHVSPPLARRSRAAISTPRRETRRRIGREVPRRHRATSSAIRQPTLSSNVPGRTHAGRTHRKQRDEPFGGATGRLDPAEYSLPPNQREHWWHEGGSRGRGGR